MFLFRSRSDNVRKKFLSVKNQTKEAKENLAQSVNLLTNATLYLIFAQENFTNVNDVIDNLDDLNNKLNVTLEQNLIDIQSVDNLLPDIQNHAKNLSQQAQELDSLLTETRISSEDAYRAANAYNDIIAAIEEANKAADSSKKFVDETATLLNVIESDSSMSEVNSANVLDDAYNTWQTIKEVESKLKTAVNESSLADSLNKENERSFKNIDKFLENLHGNKSNELLLAAKKNAQVADGIVSQSMKEIQEGFEEVLIAIHISDSFLSFNYKLILKCRSYI